MPAMPQSAAQHMNAGSWALLLTLSILWGGSFFFAEVALVGLPPLTVVMLRVTLAATALHAALWLSGRGLPSSPRVWCAFLAMGFLNNAVPFSLIVWGQTQIASGLAAILNATTPLFTVVVAGAMLTDERFTPAKAVGVLLGLAGVGLIVGPETLAGLDDDLWAQLACLGAALSYAFAGVFGRRFKRFGLTAMQTAAGQLTGSSLLMVPLALAVDRPWTLAPPTHEVWAAVIGLALLATALAYILYFRILARAGATNLLLVTFLIPVSANLLGWLVLHERLAVHHFAGMALIALGLAAIDGRIARGVARA